MGAACPSMGAPPPPFLEFVFKNRRGWWRRIIEEGPHWGCCFWRCCMYVVTYQIIPPVAGKPAYPPKVQPFSVYAALALNSHIICNENTHTENIEPDGTRMRSGSVLEPGAAQERSPGLGLKPPGSRFKLQVRGLSFQGEV